MSSNKIVEVAIRSRIIKCQNPAKIPLKSADQVVVAMGSGRSMGKVMGFVDECLSTSSCSKDSTCCTPSAEQISYTIHRTATDDDIERNKANRKRELSAFQVCKEKIAYHNLDMKLVDVEYQFEGGKITFYFTADQRVDFRALVKTLAGEFRTRIELRQIGVRDAAKLIKGVGICGRPQCCSTFMRDFAQISTQLAKDQQLTLNPAKISGNCGRLLCCLDFEEKEYLKAYKELPRVGCSFTDASGKRGLVVFVDIFKERIHVRRNEGGMNQFQWYTKEEIEKGTVHDDHEKQKK